jgi:hypothetical protein
MSNTNGKSALVAAGEVVKYLTALATGAIVFSAGLLSEKILISGWAKAWIFLSWVLLAISVAGGLLGGMRVPVQLSKQNYNLQDKYFEWPIRIQQITFFLGIVALGIAMALILVAHGKSESVTEPPPPATPSPQFSPSVAPTASASPTVRPSPETSPSPSATANPSPSSSPQVRPTPTLSPTPYPSPSATPTSTPKATPHPPRRPRRGRRCRCEDD